MLGGGRLLIDLAYTNISDVILKVFCSVKVMATFWAGQLV